MRFREIAEDIGAQTADLITFDDRWAEFVAACHALPPDASFGQAVTLTGLSTGAAPAIRAALDSWRESPTQSMFHSLAHVRPGEVPPVGTPIFPDLMWQTRFIIKARESRVLPPLSTRVVMGRDKKPVQVRGTAAMTARDEVAVRHINRIVRALYLYWFLNHRKTVKLPKRLYRGIRAADLYSHDTFKPLVDAIWKSDGDRRMTRKDVIDRLIAFICDDRRLHEITDGKLLSFTASQSIAQYFANGSGFLLAVDPKKVEIVTSELHDVELTEPDMMTGRKEREYIVRIPPDYHFTRADIIMHDLDYFIAEGNPLSVALFDHDDKSATYEMNGTKIEAYAYWRSSDKLSLVFRNRSVERDYGNNRAEFKSLYGFDPMPTTQNLDQITNFKFVKRKPYGF